MEHTMEKANGATSNSVQELQEALTFSPNLSPEQVKENNDLQQRIRSLEEEYKKVKAAKAQLEEENGELREKNEMLSSRATTVESKVKQLDSTLLEKEHLIRDQHEGLGYYRDLSLEQMEELNNLQHRFSSQEEEIKKLRAEKEELNGQLLMLESNVTPPDSTIKEKEQHLQEQQEALSYYHDLSLEQMEELNNLQHRVSSQEEEIKKLRAEKEELNGQALMLESNVTPPDSTLQEKERLLREQQEALDYYRDLSLEHAEELNDLQHRFSSLEDEKKKLMAEKEELHSKVLTLETDVKQLDSTIQEKDELFREQLESLNHYRDLSLAQVDELNDLQHRFSSLEEKTKGQLDLETKLKEEIAQLTVEKGELKDKKAQLELENGELKNEKEVLDCRVTTLESSVNQLNSDLQQKDQLLTQIQDEAQVLKISVKTAMDDSQKAHSDLNELKEKVHNLSSALNLKSTECENLHKTLGQKNQEVKNLKGSLETTKADMKRAMAKTQEKEEAEKDALRQGHEEAQELLTHEISFLRSSVSDWEERWVKQQEKMQAQISALQEEQQQKLMLLRKEKEDVTCSLMSDKVALMNKNLDSLTRVTRAETRLLESEAEWKEKNKILELRLENVMKAQEEVIQQNEQLLKESEESNQTWMAKERDWLDSKARTKLDIQVLVDQILKLHELSSMTDKEKKKLEKAKEKARKEAAKERARERREKAKDTTTT